MNTQTMPWFKFAHVEYLLDPMITSLSLAAQGANTRLMAYAARQLPFGTLPNDEKTLLAMVGIKSSKQWQKIYAELMGAVWFLNDDGRLYCSLMIVESSPVNQKEKDKQDNQANDKTLTNAERCKRYRDNKKNVGDTNDTNSDTLNMSSDTTATRKQHDTDTAKSVDSVSFEGGKGGDLDLDKEQELINTSLSLKREAEKKSAQKFFDDELFPDINTLNTKLKISGARETTEKIIRENLFEFNARYESQCLSDNQRLAKWVGWIKRKQLDDSKTFKSTNGTAQTRRMPPPDNFAKRDYSAGINADGSF